MITELVQTTTQNQFLILTGKGVLIFNPTQQAALLPINFLMHEVKNTNFSFGFY